MEGQIRDRLLTPSSVNFQGLRPHNKNCHDKARAGVLETPSACYLAHRSRTVHGTAVPMVTYLRYACWKPVGQTALSLSVVLNIKSDCGRTCRKSWGGKETHQFIIQSHTCLGKQIKVARFIPTRNQHQPLRLLSQAPASAPR